MAKSQHPAAKAGRLVRAVGLGVAKELEKRADAPPRQKPAPPPPPPPHPTKDFYGRAVFTIFVGSVVALVLVVMKGEKLFPADLHVYVRVAITVVLALGALVQLTNWHQANHRLSQRLLTRVWGPRGPMNRRERTFARIIREGLALAGIAWLGAAVFELLVALGISDATVVG